MKLWLEERWKYFEPHEVLSPGGLAALARGVFLLDPEALDRLCALREKLGPIKVNHSHLKLRGYRTPSENEAIGGAPLSVHMQGKAFDVTVDAFNSSQVSEAARVCGFTFTKIISDTSCHIDIRWRGE